MKEKGYPSREKGFQVRLIQQQPTSEGLYWAVKVCQYLVVNVVFREPVHQVLEKIKNEPFFK